MDAELFGDADRNFIDQFADGHFGDADDEGEEEGPIDFISIKMHNQKRQKQMEMQGGVISIPTSIHQVGASSP